MSHPRTPLAPVDPRQAGVIRIPEDMLRAGSNYVLRVTGATLEDEQIRDGDYVIVNARTTPERGEMVGERRRRHPRAAVLLPGGRARPAPPLGPVTPPDDPPGRPGPD